MPKSRFFGLSCATKLWHHVGMPQRSSNKKEPRDINELAFDVVRSLTSEELPEEERQKNPAAVELGRLGGLKGGLARKKKLSPRKRSLIAKKAARARWSKR
jgi:hypothetical protein